MWLQQYTLLSKVRHLFYRPRHKLSKFYLKSHICSTKVAIIDFFLVPLPTTRSSPKGKVGQTLVVKGRLRTLSSAVESRKFWPQKVRNRNVHIGCIVPYMLFVVCSINISRRGLSRVAYPEARQCESPTAG